ncbi:hypothetical protein EB796_016291 [Bugula neritina]|uniref:Uncharacterized protein n=1 Tax=Bugula neritina TaxID=10212 RepID=A0A7J7JGN6_BUGNE|nr:hypothetical protein EB796_016291 [Bugula neritina]
MFTTTLGNVVATIGEYKSSQCYTVEEEISEELRLKQQEIRKKRLEDLKLKDGERQRAAEERRKRREQEEECWHWKEVDVHRELLVPTCSFIFCFCKQLYSR